MRPVGNAAQSILRPHVKFAVTLLVFDGLEIRRKRLGNQLLAAVVVVDFVALEPVERFARTGNGIARRSRQIPYLSPRSLRSIVFKAGVNLKIAVEVNSASARQLRLAG